MYYIKSWEVTGYMSHIKNRYNHDYDIVVNVGVYGTYIGSNDDFFKYLEKCIADFKSNKNAEENASLVKVLISDFFDEELISELEKRNYKVFKNEHNDKTIFRNIEMDIKE